MIVEEFKCTFSTKLVELGLFSIINPWFKPLSFLNRETFNLLTFSRKKPPTKQKIHYINTSQKKNIIDNKWLNKWLTAILRIFLLREGVTATGTLMLTAVACRLVSRQGTGHSLAPESISTNLEQLLWTLRTTKGLWQVWAKWWKLQVELSRITAMLLITWPVHHRPPKGMLTGVFRGLEVF